MTAFKIGDRVMPTVGDFRWLVGTIVAIAPNGDVKLSIDLRRGTQAQTVYTTLRPSRVQRA